MSVLLALAGCGGGDDGRDGSGGAQSDAAAEPAPATSVASSYAANSEELAVFDLLNAERARCGFGTLAQNAALDAAARGHADVGSSARLVYLQINPAYRAATGPQLLAKGELATYPCEGTTGVNRQLRNETPNPIPGRDLATQPLGSVVYVAVREGSTLVIRSASMTEVDTGRSVALRPPVTADNDPYGDCQEGCFRPHQAYLAVNAPLAAFARYRVVIRGDNNGVAFERTFIFTTGSGG